jgi:hypothetical protein
LVAAFAPAALAAKAKNRAASVTGLAVLPKKPKATDPIDLAFRAGKLRPDERYIVGIGQLRFAGKLVAGPDNCTSSYFLVIHGRKRPRQPVDVRLYPNGALVPGTGAHVYGNIPRQESRRFCAGRAYVTVGRIDPDGNVRTIARRLIRIAEDAAYPEPTGTRVKITVLGGSALTVQAPGRPDRTLPVGGVVRGVLPGKFRPNTDIVISSLTGSLSLPAISPDPLCAAGSYTLDLALAQSTASKLLLKASGDATFSLEVLADPLSVAGCAAPATPGQTALTFTGKVGPEGLVRLPISGVVSGVPIAPDVAATVTLNLFISVDLSGRG